MMDWTQILLILAQIYGILAFIVKIVPTIPAKFPWLVTIMTILGKITNNQTDDAAVRAAQEKAATK
jgi:hypothetical protein